MTYKIARDGQEFGPYSLADVQRYVGTGNILLSDLALAEGATDWIPVAQVIGTIAVAPQMAPTSYAPGAMSQQFPDPPDLHWGLVLLLDFVTCGLFNFAWNLVQVLWIKKVQPESKAPMWYFVIIGVTVIGIIISVIAVSSVVASKGQMHAIPGSLRAASNLLSLASFVLSWCIYPFAMRTSLLKHFNESDPIGLELNGAMTFFFTSLYFQYHFNRINEMKRAYRLTNPS